MSHGLLLSALLAGCALLASCAAERTPDPASADAAAPLRDRDWTVTVLDGAPLDGDHRPTLRFGADGVSGSTGLNSFGGQATIAGDKLTVGALRMTRRAGPPEAMQRESAFTGALAAATTWTIEGGALALRDADGAVRLRAK